MKKFIKTTLSAMLALAVGVMPSVAVGDTDSAGESANTVRKYTPVVDGVIDEEYLSSYGIDHVWNAEPSYYGKYSANGGAAYGWDAQASSHLLWDDENLYVAVKVTDDDYGCVDDEHYGIIDSFGVSTTSPHRQDGAFIYLKYGEMMMRIYASRDGKLLFSTADPRIQSDTEWCDVLIWDSERIDGDGSQYAVTEAEGGYVIEACIRVKEDVRGDLMLDGGVFSYGLAVVDSTSDSPYCSISEMIMSEDMSDGWWLADTVIIGEGLDPETNEVILKPLTLSDEAAVGTTGANTMRKFTPVVDGVIDEEYKWSFRIDHEWAERTADNHLATGKYEFPVIGYDENGYRIYCDKTAYEWDLKASSYYLWDDDNLYIAVEVTDDDYGCIDDEHYDIALKHADLLGPIRQDGILMNLIFGDRVLPLFASRNGEAMYNTTGYGNSYDVWCDLASWYDIKSGDGEDMSYYAVCETENGYVIEMCLKVNEPFGDELLTAGGTFGCSIVAIDAAAESAYVPLTETIITGQYFPGDSWMLEDTFWLTSIYEGDTKVLTLTLSDEEAVALPPYDLTADGVFDTKDLTRLMRFIAGDSAAVVAQNADINEDGAVDVKDLTRMMKYLAEN